MSRFGGVFRDGAGRLAPPGVVLVVLGLGCWIGGILSGWRELNTVAAGCLMVVLLALLFTIGKASVDVKLELEPRRIVAGEQAVGRVVVHNPLRRRVLPFRLEVPVGAGVVQVEVPSMAHDAEVDEVFVIPTSRRCVMQVGPVSATRGDPLGLARRSVQGRVQTELFVHPKTRRIHGLSTGLLQDLEGRSTDRSASSGIAFHGLREYVPGDDRRHVHWRTSARVGQLMVRQFVDVRQSQMVLLLSAVANDYRAADEFELAVSIAGSLGATAASEGQAVSLLVHGAQHKATSASTLLDSLARLELTAADVSLTTRVRTSFKSMTRAGIVICVTGSGTPASEVRVVAELMPPHLRVIMVQATSEGVPHLRSAEGATFLSSPSLDGFAQLVRQRIDV
jgi:uncharacterized protein (DUF58 family)